MSSSPKLRPNYTESQAQLSSAVFLYAVICGSAVATVYFSQPLLDMMATEFGMNRSIIGTVVTVTQICYAFGLLFLVPLGDMFNPRRLVTGMIVLLSIALSIVALASKPWFLFLGLGTVGFQAVVAQVLVALAADRAPQYRRGRTIGVVTSGIVIGILLARTFSGTLADMNGWRSVYIVSAVIMISLAFVFLTVTPDTRRPPSKNSYREVLRSIKDLFVQIPLLRIRGLLAFFIFSDFSIPQWFCR
ncbi:MULTISPECIES: MFS transporter [Paenibacillus]|uniref:MFS transporter n=1 Tax=Paenibacillus TaxID=44249 RepID=UPI0021B1D247|nr:MFS transporter [Paenibacillus sp. IHBB 10380]